MANVLLVGESWFVHSIHQKGFDTFTESVYGEGAGPFLDALKDTSHNVTYIRSHEISTSFPADAASLDQYDVIIISDVGANTFQLTPEVFSDSVAGPDYLGELREYVARGGGLLMVGGYMTFTGIDGKARWGQTAIAETLPVTMLERDDRVELPAGAPALVTEPHPVTEGIDKEWPALLGLNEVEAKEGSEVLATVDAHPLLVVGEYKQGRTAAFTSDFAPHWAPPAFTSWAGYGRLWDQLITWLGSDK